MTYNKVSLAGNKMTTSQKATKSGEKDVTVVSDNNNNNTNNNDKYNNYKNQVWGEGCHCGQSFSLSFFWTNLFSLAEVSEDKMLD